MINKQLARNAWGKGARTIGTDRNRALDHFLTAVRYDQGMADAWLGVHAAGGDQHEAVTQMFTHHKRFGEERKRSNLALRSTYTLGPYVSAYLDTGKDLWCATAADHIARGELAQADRVLATLDEQMVHAVYLRGWSAFNAGNDDVAIGEFRRLFGYVDLLLEASARLLSSASLVRVKAYSPARDHLRWLLNQQSELPARLLAEANVAMSNIADEEGDQALSRDYLHQAYAVAPDFPGVREAIRGGSSGGPGPREPVAAGAQPAAAEDASEDEPGEEQEETVEDILAELNHQIGQDGIKRQVKGLLAGARAELARREAGLPAGRLTEHFVFTGPPGTGKTTIARIVARLYKALGILEKGHVVEVDRSGLIGQYHGHTVARVTERVDEALGGVLFVDEAYALQTEGFAHGDSFGQEAIDTLLKRMEDDRDSLVVIAAGYPEPMEKFLDSNPGLRSRFTTTVAFTPYSIDELVQIADLMATDTGNKLTDDGRAAVRNVLEDLEILGVTRQDTFGNARYARNLIEKAARTRDLRVFGGETITAPPDVAALTEITAADVEDAARNL